VRASQTGRLSSHIPSNESRFVRFRTKQKALAKRPWPEPGQQLLNRRESSTPAQLRTVRRSPCESHAHDNAPAAPPPKRSSRVFHSHLHVGLELLGVVRHFEHGDEARELPLRRRVARLVLRAAAVQLRLG
jgi:hypothetical protein